MATALPFHIPLEPPASGRSVELGRAYAEHLRATHPEHFASLNVTADELAERFAASGLTIHEAVAAGEMSAAESRYLQFRATREDLVEFGHSPEEIETILEEQRRGRSS